jgi:large subunit ribosomal protein L22
MPYKYSIKTNEHMAKAVGVLLPISTKHAIEICNMLRGKNLQDAKAFLEDVANMKKPVKFDRFSEGAGHKHGIGPGKYPVKASKEILNLLKLVESNAQQKALETSSLVIIHICAKKGPNTWKYGRQTRVSMKRTNVEVAVEEKEKTSKPKKQASVKEKTKPAKEQEKKQETNKINEAQSKKQTETSQEKRIVPEVKEKVKNENKNPVKSQQEKTKQAEKK